MNFWAIQTRYFLIGTIFLALTVETNNSPSTTFAQREITNSVGMKFRLIPAGEFLMGTDVRDADQQF